MAICHLESTGWNLEVCSLKIAKFLNENVWLFFKAAIHLALEDSHDVNMLDATASTSEPERDLRNEAGKKISKQIETSH